VRGQNIAEFRGVQIIVGQFLLRVLKLDFLLQNIGAIDAAGLRYPRSETKGR
jgi:hypothetical protein